MCLRTEAFTQRSFYTQKLSRTEPFTYLFAQKISQHYFVPQSLHNILASTTLYYKACTKYFPVLLYTNKACTKYVAELLCTTKLAQRTSLCYFVLQAWTKYIAKLLCTRKLAQSTSQDYLVLQSSHKVLPSTTLYYKACTKLFPALLRTTNLAGHYNAFCGITWLVSTHMATEDDNNHAAIPLRSATTDSISA